MVKRSISMINTSECEHCTHSEIDDSNKAKVVVHCRAKNKDYIYGQCVPCDEKKVKK